MTLTPRHIAGIALILVAFYGVPAIPTPSPSPPPSIKVTLPLRSVPAGRRGYLADFYDAMATVIERDGKREDPGIGDTFDFTALHAGALQLAIDRDQVGSYPGLGDAVDQAFRENIGDDVQAVDASVREKLSEVCRAIAEAFRNG